MTLQPSRGKVTFAMRISLTKQQSRVLRLIKAKHSQAEVADILGVTKQRVFQIVERLRELGELPREEAS